MFKYYNKDQKLVLLGACLYYMGLGGFIFNSQSTVLAAVRTLYDFPMTKMSLYTTAGYATQIFASMLLGSVIFKLSQPMKKYYFACICWGLQDFCFWRFLQTHPCFTFPGL